MIWLQATQSWNEPTDQHANTIICFYLLCVVVQLQECTHLPDVEPVVQGVLEGTHLHLPNQLFLHTTMSFY